MATTMPERPATPSIGPRPRPGPESTRWETFSWWFFRVSGVALIFLAIIHLVLMHVVTDVSATGYDFVAARAPRGAVAALSRGDYVLAAGNDHHHHVPIRRHTRQRVAGRARTLN